MSESVASRDVELLDELKQSRAAIVAELRKVIVGHDEVVEQLLTALFANGHCLLVGVPGLAKTLLVSTIARALDLEFSRIQFRCKQRGDCVLPGGAVVGRGRGEGGGHAERRR